MKHPMMHLSLFNCCLMFGLLSLIRSDVHPIDRASDMTIERTLPQLARYNISTITVSGLSAGGYMAVQLHVAHSIIVSGAAVFAGGPFYCAEGLLNYAVTKCMDGTFGGPEVGKLVDLTYSDAELKYIDHPSNMKDDKVFIYSGLSDTTVDPLVVRSLQAYYSYFTAANNIQTQYSINSEHCIPTLNYGEECSAKGSPYLGNCNYDGAGAALKALYGTNVRFRATAQDASRLFSFAQSTYTVASPSLSSLSDIGYVYIPSTCEDRRTVCSLHISFHGCEQTLSDIGTVYAVHAGFNEWAESNNIIVLYPYAIRSKQVPYNPNGCWDWWGYTNYLYGVQQGVQVRFVRDMIKDIAGR